jgi:hypothetical protein
MQQHLPKFGPKWTLSLAILGIVSSPQLLNPAKAQGFVSTTGSSSSKTSSSGASGQKAKDQKKLTDIEVIEGAIGRKLTDDERTAIEAAIKTRDAALQSAQSTFLSTVSSITGLSSAQVQSNGGGRGNIARVVSNLTSTTLSDAQKTSLQSAESTRNSAVRSAIDTYKATVAKTLNMSVEELDKLVAKFLASQQGGQRGQGHGQGGGKCGGGSGSSSGSGSTTTTMTTTTTGGYN